MSFKDALTAIFWKKVMGWEESIWDIADNRLPILRNVGGVQEPVMVTDNEIVGF
ncbi:MAG: hypothetical protein FWF85_05050 [Clostridiales bacterium]|nr:hypothetical protein [Clostridiales bacterium]